MACVVMLKDVQLLTTNHRKNKQFVNLTHRLFNAYISHCVLNLKFWTHYILACSFSIQVNGEENFKHFHFITKALVSQFLYLFSTLTRNLRTIFDIWLYAIHQILWKNHVNIISLSWAASLNKSRVFSWHSCLLIKTQTHKLFMNIFCCHFFITSIWSYVLL